MAGHDVIVIGASAGGVEAIITLTAALPRDLPAAVFVVIHMAADSPSRLPQILERTSNMPVAVAKDKDPIEVGHIYVAAPDHHLILEKDVMRVIRGPKENRYRPAIDPLFRSAALYFGPQVIGVVLTGSLDDGTAGLLAIKQRGGLAVVQDPAQALYPSMPANAIAHVVVDHILLLADIGPSLVQLVNSPVQHEGALPVTEDMEREVNLVKMDIAAMESEKRNGTPSVFSCPECHGVLWEMQEDSFTRYRCRVGHAFSVESMMAEQNTALEVALWSALKTLQESADLSRRLARQARERNQSWLVQRFEAKAQQAEIRAGTIEAVLQSNNVSHNPARLDDDDHLTTDDGLAPPKASL